MQLLVWSLALVPALTAVAVAAGHAASRGQRPWLPLAGIWVAVVLAQYLARVGPRSFPLGAAVFVLAPLGVVALAVEMEVKRGCSLWQAGSVAVALGIAAAVTLPFLLWYLPPMVAWVARAIGSA